ncbi:MAG: M28 family peptidase [Blastomonas sp.]
MNHFTRLVLALSCLPAISPALAQHAPITEDELREHITVLASDEFEGRGPGTRGENLSIDYIARQWAGFGLVSGTEDPDHRWFQPVPLVERNPWAFSAQFARGGKALKLPADRIQLVGRDAANQARGGLIFVGYGADADGKVIADVRGKIAIMMTGQPDFAPDENYPARAERAVALADAGAEAVISVLGPQFSWAAVQNSLKRGATSLGDADRDAAITGFMAGDYAAMLFEGAGSDLAMLQQAAANPEFSGVDLPVSAEFMATSTVRRFDSHNVIGKLPGRIPGSGAVVLTGHWDHLGICRDESHDDRICNGAIDNASGIAVMTAMAKRLAEGPSLDRDVYFIATTAEERGLLGARHYAAHPAFPLENIVVLLNIDTIAVHQAGAPSAIIGRGTSPLAEEIDKVAAEMGRTVELSEDANSFLRRQDGWEFTKKGVPAFMVGGSFADLDFLQNFLGEDYHQPSDEVNDRLVLSGAREDAELHLALVRHFADSQKYPVPATRAR